jgi:hypothetical protein
MAEIRWVDRNEQGKICGHYARKQDWHKENDFVLEDAPELLAFNTASKAAMEAAQQAQADKDALIGKLSADVATLTAQLSEANVKLAELDQIKADVAALKVAK